MAKAKKKSKAKAKGKAKAKKSASSKQKLAAASTALWTELVHRAMTDEAFRRAFDAAPAQIAASLGLNLKSSDNTLLETIRTDVMRFSVHPNLAVRDIEAWQMGLMHHVQLSRCKPIPE